MKKPLTLLLALCAALSTGAASAQTVMVAAASDLTYCIDELAAAFRKEAPGTDVKVTLGASGNFFAQIKNGAPYDVFLSADTRYPSQLASEGAANAATLTTYAIGRVALWSMDPRFDLSQGMRVLADARVTKVAIANPDVAPYGRAAKAALLQHGFWDTIKDKLVIGENVAQTAQFVQTGNAQVGLVSYATVLAPKVKGKGSYYLVPEGGAPIGQGGIVTKHGSGNAQAARFLQFLQSQAAREILVRHGFGLPRAAHG
jgi:molybdate transport system substrate-binding protein